MLNYGDFSTRVVELLELDCSSPIGPDEDLYTDLGLDSLQAFQLLIVARSTRWRRRSSAGDPGDLHHARCLWLLRSLVVD